MQIGEQIRAKRNKDRLSAKALSILLSIPYDNIYKWEKGTKISDPEDYKKINDWLGNKLEEIPIVEELQKTLGYYEERLIRAEVLLKHTKLQYY